MKNCEQTAGQSVYQHGISVHEYFVKIINGETENMRIPDWFTLNKEKILTNIHNSQIIHDYTIFHDCGKPFCKVIDDQGKVHFPDHAQVSKKTYLEYTGDQIVANLIGHDMDIHTASSEEIETLCETWSVKDAMTLLVASLAEIHSNARLFGGPSTVSFKSKWKTIDRRGKQICKHYFK